jgi:hypothetical protein
MKIDRYSGQGSVVGWLCKVELQKKHERILLGWTNHPAKVINCAHGFLIMGLFHAAKSGEEGFNKWYGDMGLDVEGTSIQALKDEVQEIENAISAFSVKHPDDLFSFFAQKAGMFPYQAEAYNSPVQIVGHGENYVFTCESILPLIAFECMELIRMNKKIEQCYCGQWYFRQWGQKGKHCLLCKPLSRRPVAALSEKEKEKCRLEARQRITKYRKSLKRVKKQNTKKLNIDRVHQSIKKSDLIQSIMLPSYNK